MEKGNHPRPVIVVMAGDSEAWGGGGGGEGGRVSEWVRLETKNKRGNI